MAFDAKTFSKALKVKRAEKSWSQEDLAKATGISLGTIARYEAGINSPSFENVCKISEAFRCATDDFHTKHRSFTSARRSR